MHCDTFITYHAQGTSKKINLRYPEQKVCSNDHRSDEP